VTAEAYGIGRTTGEEFVDELLREIDS